MSEGRDKPPQREADRVGEALRTAIERTLDATAGSAASTRERATGLVDELARLGRGARDELARRGQEAGVGLARRGQEASGEVAKRLELLERRLGELEDRLGGGPQNTRPEGETAAPPDTEPKPQAED